MLAQVIHDPVACLRYGIGCPYLPSELSASFARHSNAVYVNFACSRKDAPDSGSNVEERKKKICD